MASQAPTLALRAARRLALLRGGLLRPDWTGHPESGRGAGKRAREAAQRVVERFGYLQLDTVSIAGTRSHGLVLAARLEGFEPGLAETLLAPGAPLFEYWGHEASWLPLELYPAFEFRRQDFREHPWWGDVVGENPQETGRLLSRIRDEGPLRSLDMEGRGSRGWWDLKLTRRIAAALWSSGELAISERRNFQRTFDLTERVIPKALRESPLSKDEAFDRLLLGALAGHGWATTGTLARTWRLVREREAIDASLRRLVERGDIVACALESEGRPVAGWILPRDLELAARAERLRPRRDRGVLLSPFDPVLWDRARVRTLFGFDQVLEIFKPAAQRKYGYYCLPVLAGERLVARFDLKAERGAGQLRVLSCRFEGTGGARPECAEDGEAAHSALERYADAVALAIRGWRRPAPRSRS